MYILENEMDTLMQFQKIMHLYKKTKNVISQIIQTCNLCICLNNSSSIWKYSTELKEKTIGIIDKFLSKLFYLETLQVKESK